VVLPDELMLMIMSLTLSPRWPPSLKYVPLMSSAET